MTTPWRSWGGLAALVVLAADLVWYSVLLSRGFFGQDDFVVITDVATHGLSQVFGPDHTGGFSPGGTLLAWAVTSLAPLGWGAAVVPVLLAKSAAGVVLWPLLTRLLGDRWIRLPLLVLFCSTPLVLWATQWWWVGIRFWPATAFLMVACWALVADVQDDSRRRDPLVLGGFALALLFSQLAVLGAIPLLGLAVVTRPGETLREKAVGLRQVRRVVGGVVLLIAAYAVLRAFLAPPGTGGGPEVGTVVTQHLRYLLAEAWGGPWTGHVEGHAALTAPTWSVALGAVLLVAVAALTLQRGGATARAAWLVFVVHTAVATGVLVLLSQASSFAALGLVPRVAAESGPVLVLCLAGALSGVDLDAAAAEVRVRGRSMLRAGVAEPVLAVLVSVALVASAAVTWHLLAPGLYHREARDYVTTLRSELRDDPTSVLHDSGVPAGVIDPLFGERAVVSQVVGAAPERPLFDVPTSKLRVVTGDGFLVEPVLPDAVRAKKADATVCPYPVRSAGTRIPLRKVLPPDHYVAKIGYYTNAESFVDLRAGATEGRFAATPGLHVVYVAVDGALDGMDLTLEDEGTLCVTNVDVGIPAGAVS